MKGEDEAWGGGVCSLGKAAGIRGIGRLRYSGCKGRTGMRGETGLPAWQFYEEFD